MMKARSEQRANSAARTVGRPFTKGRSGNPGGRPRMPEELKGRAQAYSVEALDTLHALMRDPEQSGSVRVSAAVAIMDRGYGKPTMSVTMGPKHSIADFTTAELRALAAASPEGQALIAARNTSTPDLRN